MNHEGHEDHGAKWVSFINGALNAKGDFLFELQFPATEEGDWKDLHLKGKRPHGFRTKERADFRSLTIYSSPSVSSV